MPATVSRRPPPKKPSRSQRHTTSTIAVPDPEATRRSGATRCERVDIEGLTDEGDGIGKTQDGRLIRVAGVIAGERVEVSRSLAGPAVQTRGPAPADLVRVLTPSPHRVAPGCVHANLCGGCTWQHIAYEEQLRLKRDMCRQWLNGALGRLSPDVDPVMPSPHEAGSAPWGYRQKVHFVFGDRDGTLVLGHFIRRSSRVLPVTECPVHAPDGNRLAFALRDALISAKVPAAAADLRRGTVRHVVVRVAANTSERAVTVVTRCVDGRVAPAAERAVEAAGLAESSISLNLHDGDDSYLFGSSTRMVCGASRIREEVAGTSYLLSPTAFFQTNVAGAEQLVALVMAAMPRIPTVVADLYAGVGLFALALARKGHTVVAVEENAQAVHDGVASRRVNRIPESRCRFVTGRVGDILGRGLGAAPRVVVMDPPRSGCEPRVLQSVCRDVRPERIVYVSCNPAALADDLASAAAFGYAATRVTPVDMFPHTAHIEAVAVMEPRSRQRK